MRLMRRIFKFDFWFYFSGVLAIGVILFWWLRMGLSRYFDPDELAHLHWAWLQFRGEKPYVDFFYVLSPLFNFLFYPLFLVFGESISVLIFARVISFLIYLLTALAIFLLGRELFGKRTGVLSVVFFVTLPIGLAKQIEIRPDNLSVAFFVLGLWAFFRGFCKAEFKSCKAEFKWFFWSGLFLGAGAAVIQKGAVSAFAAVLLMVLLVVFLRRHDLVKIFRRVFWGMTIPVLVLLIYLLFKGVLIQGLEAIVVLALLTNLGIPFAPLHWFFLPIDIYYGGYRNFPYVFNRILFVFAGLAVLFFLLKVLKKRKWKKEEVGVLSLAFLAVFLTFLLEALKATFLQYYLPVFPLVSILGAVGFLSLLEALKISDRTKLIFYVCFLGACLFSSYKSYVGREKWINEGNLKHIFAYLSVSGPEDRVFDFWGFYVFRKDGYFVCCNHFPDFPKKLKARLPDFVGWMKKNENKFITYQERDGGIIGNRIALLSQKQINFLRENYVPIGVREIRVVGHEFDFGKSPVEKVEIFAAGEYRVVGGEIMIDGKRYGSGGVVFLGKGMHEFGGRGKVTVRYNWEEKKITN